MNIEIVTVTPETAQKWLSTNTENNRKLSKTTVNRYANDMIRGKWLLTGEAIKFDTDGNLIDGQHRLQAVVASKKTVQMCVVKNLQPETMLVIDTGKSRSAGDALNIVGHNGYSNEMAALARKIIGLKHGNDVLDTKAIRIAGQPITNQDIVAFCANSDITEHLKFGHRIHYQQVTSVLNRAEYQFFHWYFSRIDPAAAESFLTKLATLDDIGTNSPIRKLIEKINRSQVKLDAKQKFCAIILAWNAWRKGETLYPSMLAEYSANQKSL